MKTVYAFAPLNRIRFIVVACSFALCIPSVPAQDHTEGATNGHKLNYAELRKVPEKARLKMNPLENDPDAPIAGGKLFERSCAECHGLKAEGGKRGPSLLRGEVQQA